VTERELEEQYRQDRERVLARKTRRIDVYHVFEKVDDADCLPPDAALATDGRVNSKVRRAIERADLHLPGALDWYEPTWSHSPARKDDRS
jgi:hypothetical protein